MTEKLVRSRRQRVLGGVCAGLATYLRLDPTLVRLFFVLLALADGVGFLLYLALWIVLPVEGTEGEPLDLRMQSGVQEIRTRARSMGGELSGRSGEPKLSNWIGIFLILFGSLVLLKNLGIPWLAWLNFDVLWPLLLVIAGLVILVRRGRE
ncbi:MAG: PspC domain-containing protein [Anaerolineales bacterium]